MYVDLAGLARYKRDFDAWARGALLPKDAAAARVRTAKAGAVSFVPVQRTPLDVSVDFLFAETPPASGDKSPGNPSTIAGVTQAKVTRCGKNLAELNRVYALPNRGITVSVNTDGSIHAAGTVGSITAIVDIGNHDDSANKQLPYWMEVGKTYTLSFSSSDANGNPRAVMYLPNSTTAWGSPYSVYPGESYTFTVDSSRKRALIRISFDANSTVNCDCYIQIEEGSSATSFDGTIPDVYTLPLGGTYYGGTLDVASGVMTVSSQKVTMDGSCSYVYLGGLGNGTGFVAVVVTIPSLAVTKGYFIASRCACNKFPVFSTETPEFSKAGMFLANPNLSYFNYKQVRFYLSLDMLGLSSSATQQEVSNAAKDWFTANPVDTVFTFAEPFSTVQLSPTEILSLTQSSVYDPRVNTVYGDASAVQVGYLKHPSAASADLRNALVSLGGGV